MATADHTGTAAGVPAPAVQIARQLTDALDDLVTLPVPGARELIVIRGITPSGTFTVPVENVVQQLIPLLVPAEGPPRVFTYADSVMFARGGTGADASLVPVCTDTDVTKAAPGVLANLMIVEQPGKDGVVQFSVPAKVLSVLLNAEPLRQALARVDLYARRPVFSADFTLLAPGYHPDCRILVHGTEIDPVTPTLPAGETVLDRLPPLLRQLLAGFCFKTASDLTNFVGLMLTGLLANHFLDGSKAVALLDGNQPGVGKTLACRVFGIVIDGEDPHLIDYTPNDEELRKRICATLRSGLQSVLVFDNAKQASGLPISSAVIESNSVARNITIRLLGTNTNFSRPNDVSWCITMNQTQVSPDLMSRGLPIRLAYEGPTGSRTFSGPEPLDFARQNRLVLLAELAGFVVRWTQAGRPDGVRPHRCHRWAQLIGGILRANGFPDFLDNYEAASGEFNSDLDDLGVLASAALAQPNGPFVVTTPQETAP